MTNGKPISTFPSFGGNDLFAATYQSLRWGRLP
ncbi:hypothetical protein DM48_7524 [Burkholderia gladioli]|uniref:Uncharacterized protein n=1 Tax=Burkholderia gladioli TaxID=28095 RepID=A0AAW3EVK6_BURGA|nr:hypothetical protein DM48_7524 [Burkholderia gladioli]